jgi:hypothetical protein
VKTSDADTSPLTPLHEVPRPSTASTCSNETDTPPYATSSSATSSSDYGDCDNRPDFDESELGEFLLDAFDGFDMAASSAELCT